MTWRMVALLYSTRNSDQCCVAAWTGGSLGENGYMYMHGWVPSLFTWNYHHIVNQLSDQISRSVVSDSWRPHESQHAGPPCPSPTPRVYSNSCAFSRWCHPTISSSVVPFSSCLQSFPASGSFLMSQLFASGGESTGASVSASVLPVSTQGWFLWGLTGLISLLSRGLSSLLKPTIHFLCANHYAKHFTHYHF